MKDRRLVLAVCAALLDGLDRRRLAAAVAAARPGEVDQVATEVLELGAFLLLGYSSPASVSSASSAGGDACGGLPGRE